MILSPRFRSFATALLLVCLILCARVRYTGSDPRVTLLTAQALLETGRPKLDRYLPAEVISRENIAPWSIWKFRGALYNFYPPGTSILALPAVAIARAAGLDMVKTRDDSRLQILLAAFLVASIFLIFERIARLFLPEGAAFLVSLVFVLGTSITSTIGTALWAHGPMVLLSALALWHLCAAHAEGRDPNGMVLGLILGLGFWCRPTAVLPTVLVFALLLLRARREALRFAITGGAVAAALVAASIAEIGDLLPVYYSMSTWPANAEPVIGILGVLFSPGRGLLIFSPFLMVGLAGWASRHLRREPLFLLATLWAGSQVILVARNADWWGGWCYGPRLLCDSLPAWFLMVVLVASRLGSHRQKPACRRLVVAALVAATVLSIGIHTGQGLFNPATWTWNDRPNVYDDPVEKLFDVSNPQFLATRKRNREAARKYYGNPPPRR